MSARKHGEMQTEAMQVGEMEQQGRVARMSRKESSSRRGTPMQLATVDVAVVGVGDG